MTQRTCEWCGGPAPIPGAGGHGPGECVDEAKALRCKIRTLERELAAANLQLDIRDNLLRETRESLYTHELALAQATDRAERYREALEDIEEIVEGEADITNSGGPNTAMKIQVIARLALIKYAALAQPQETGA